MSGPADEIEREIDGEIDGERPGLDGRQLAEWTVEAMSDPALLDSADPLEPRSRRLVRDAVRALRRAELESTKAR